VRETTEYTRSNRPDIHVRTLNPTEIRVCRELEADGWVVVKRGWPDFLAYRNGRVRFIEVKPISRRTKQPKHLKPSQAMVARWLKEAHGIDVEVVS